MILRRSERQGPRRVSPPCVCVHRWGAAVRWLPVSLWRTRDHPWPPPGRACVYPLSWVCEAPLSPPILYPVGPTRGPDTRRCVAEYDRRAFGSTCLPASLLARTVIYTCLKVTWIWRYRFYRFLTFLVYPKHTFKLTELLKEMASIWKREIF